MTHDHLVALSERRGDADAARLVRLEDQRRQEACRAVLPVVRQVQGNSGVMEPQEVLRALCVAIPEAGGEPGDGGGGGGAAGAGGGVAARRRRGGRRGACAAVEGGARGRAWVEGESRIAPHASGCRYL